MTKSEFIKLSKEQQHGLVLSALSYFVIRENIMPGFSNVILPAPYNEIFKIVLGLFKDGYLIFSDEKENEIKNSFINQEDLDIFADSFSGKTMQCFKFLSDVLEDDDAK